MGLSFDGVSDKLDSPVTLPNSACTVSMWVRQATFSDGTVFGAYAAPSSFDRTVQVNADGTVACRMWSSAGDRVVFSTATRLPGEWCHLLYRCGPSAGGQRLVLDGSAVLNPLQYSSQVPTQAYVRIGSGTFFAPSGDNLGVRHFMGDVAEFAIWGTELAEAEEATLAAAVSPLALTNRLGSMLFYRDLISDADRPGVGPLVSVSGAPGSTERPRMLVPNPARYPGGLFPRSPAPYSAVARQIGLTTAIAGQAA